jgi:hypothetical protein
MEGRSMADHPAGKNQVIATYGTEMWEDTRGNGLTTNFMDLIASDAAARAADGWRIVTTTMLATRYTGTAGSVLTNSGDGYPTDVMVTVVYGRAA